MNQEKYTERMRGFLQSAQMLALREGHQRLVPDHLLKVLLEHPERLAHNLIQTDTHSHTRASTHSPPRTQSHTRQPRHAHKGRSPGRGPDLHGARDGAHLRPG